MGGTAGFGTPCLVKPLTRGVFHADVVLIAGTSLELAQAADPTTGFGAAITAEGAGLGNPGSGLHNG